MAEKEIPVKYRLKAIEVLEVKLECPLIPNPKNITYGFTINVEQKVDVKKKCVIVFIEILVAVEVVEKESMQVGSVKLSYIYEVDNLESFINTKTGLVKFPDEFNTTLNDISISTSRGVLFSLFKGTFLHNAILPLVNPKDIVPKEKSS